MNIIDFSEVEQNDIPYGGNAGFKQGIVFEQENWFLKFPKSTRGFRNMEISYTTSPLSEYVGSQIYKSLQIPVHDTTLGIFGRKPVVACKDFLSKGDRLYEFRELKNIYSSELEKFQNSSESTGSGTDLESILKILETNRVLTTVEGVKERFWDMFVVDALIGNNDRNNGNWGVIYQEDGSRKLAPVYDNGNAFRNKASDRQLAHTLHNENAMKDSAYKLVNCVYTDQSGKSINPFTFIESMSNDDCNEAVKRVLRKLDLEKINQMIEDIPESYKGVTIVSKEQKAYFENVLRIRQEDVLNPVFKKLRVLEERLPETAYHIVNREKVSKIKEQKL